MADPNVEKKTNYPVQWLFRWLVAFLMIALLVVFAKLAEDVWFREGFRWDAPIILAIHNLGNPPLDTVMKFVTQTGETGSITIALALAGWFWWKRRKNEALSVLVAFGGAVGINTLLKLLFARPRPHLFPPLVVESGFSFPSGHVTASVAVYGFLAFLLWQHRHYGWALLSAGWILMIAISRIYLGVHYPSDTVAAMACAGLWLILVLYVQNISLSRRKRPSL